MKNRVASVATLVLLFACTTPAQQRSRVELELGSVTVWLGMPQQEVLSKVAMAGYQKVSQSTDGKMLEFLSESPKGLYSVGFAAGRLVFAGRNWHIGDDVTDAVIHALAAIGKQKLCKISHEPIAEPEFEANRVFIICGQRSVLIMKHKSGKLNVVSVSERIGEVPD